MKKLILLLFVLLVIPVKAQEDIFLPIIFKGNDMAIDPRLVITDGDIEVDLLQGGWKLADPYWNPAISQYKAGGTFVNSQLAEGRRMVYQEYDNVIETIPLSLRGTDQAQAMKTAHDALALLRQAGDYWTEPYEYDQVWIEVKLPCNACLTGYSRIIKGTIPELTNPFGQPSFSPFNESVMEGITLTIEREPFWQITKPSEIIGPLYNLIDNPDFELWNFGVVDSQPDNWTDIETTHIAGQNSRSQDFFKFGQSSLKVRVSGSTLAGAAKGVTQVIVNTKDDTEYTIIAWVRSEGVSNGVGRILINYASQLELYRDSVSHGWTLYTGKITTGSSDVVSINAEILTTAANTDGTIYIDGLMFVEGDWEQEAIDNVLPYLSGSHIVNHWDKTDGNIEAGDINYVDAWNVPGTVDSLIRLEVINNTTPAEDANIVEVFKKIRIGMRRTGDVFLFDNYFDIQGQTDTSASSDDKLVTQALNNNYVVVASRDIKDGALVPHNGGRFRTFARVQDLASPPNLQTRLSYYVGAKGNNVKILNPDTAQVAEQWTIVDLTTDKAVVQDVKNTNLGQLGYILEMARATGNEAAWLDYIFKIPTDGGYIEIDFDSPIIPRNAVVIDGENSQVTGAFLPNNEWNTLLEISEETHLYGIKDFKGSLYVAGDNGGVYKVVNTNQYEQVFDVLTQEISLDAPLEVYNGKLILGIGREVVNLVSSQVELYSTVDGLGWALEVSIKSTPANGHVRDLKSFNGNLYVMVMEGANGATIYKYDGSTASLIYTDSNANPTKGRFAIYENRLYAILGNTLLVLNDTQTAFSSAASGAANMLAIDTFNEKIYAVRNTSGDVWAFDGSTFAKVADLPTGHPQTVNDLEPYNEKLFAGGLASAPAVTNLSFTSNGTTWFNKLLPGWSVNKLYVFNGVLYGVGSVPANIYTYSDFAQVVSYTISDYSGSAKFLAPSRKSATNFKRHRYFFSYDRADFINNLDDKALIGLGFVPRYLELPMKEN